jgi:hypothetical protein
MVSLVRDKVGIASALVASQLLFGAGQGAPQPLLFVWHKAQNQFAGYVPSGQPFGICEIPLPPLRRLVGMRLRQFQPVSALQRLPHRLPVLRGRLHDHFLHALFGQPRVEQTQIATSRSELAPLKPKFAYSGCVRDHHRQHLLVNVYTCYVRCHFHAFLQTREESVPGNTKHPFALSAHSLCCGDSTHFS